MIQGILISLSSLKEGWDYIKSHRNARRLIWQAIALDVIGFIVAFLVVGSVVFYALNTVITNFISDNWFLELISRFLAFIIGFFIVAQTFSLISSILNAPLYGKLADDIIKHKRAINDDEFSLGFRENITKTVLFEIKKLLLVSLLFALSLLLNIIPIVGQILFVIITLFQLIIIAGLDLFEPILITKPITFRRKIYLMTRFPAYYWPFLIIAGILTGIPILNILTTPVMTASAICLYVKKPLDG